jgi:hypothetical protein
MNCVLLFLSLAIWVGYIALTIIYFGVPTSISESYYKLEKRWKCGYAFTIWCMLIAFSVAAMMFECSEGKWFQFLGLFAGGGLGFVGAAPLFKSHERTIHYVSAGTCAAASVAWMALMGYWYVPISYLSLGYGVSLMNGNRVFWMETALFASMYLTLTIN